ncbi:unnamed protein product [Rodentolepis nana]|uniref:ABC transporter domain-containing protein n=1 Tax=Rodentolepis nana TaxID=102285 RepID=A0A0R3TIJ9_RODNA|nr:unnamed protein product [Rodentolepis nana]
MKCFIIGTSGLFTDNKPRRDSGYSWSKWFRKKYDGPAASTVLRYCARRCSMRFILQILLDGVDIRELKVSWLRSQLGVVSQEPNLFAGTVTENIQLGNPDADFNEIERAAKQADAHNFILSLPDVRNMIFIIINYQ